MAPEAAQLGRGGSLLLLALVGGASCAARSGAGGAVPPDDPPTVRSHRGYPAVAASHLGEVGARRVAWAGGELTLETGRARVHLRPGSPFVRVGTDVRQLAHPAYLADGDLWVPVELVRAVLPGADLRLAEGGGEAAPAGWDRAAAGRSGEAGSRRAPGDGAGEREGEEDARSQRKESPPFVVVIDAGHGGVDPGTHGPGGTREKDVTLAVARRLKARLEEAQGIVPVMTRDRDTLIALMDRSRMAISTLTRVREERAAPDAGGLFLSIHANASRARSARGFETYFLAPAKTEQAREVAMRENSAVRYEEGDPAPELNQLQFILADLDQGIWMLESNRFAGHAQNALRGVLAAPDRGVKQAGFLVLVGASGSMPAALVEVGFLSNSRTETYLRSETGHAEIARALAEAVSGYRQQYERRIIAAGAGG